MLLVVNVVNACVCVTCNTILYFCQQAGMHLVARRHLVADKFANVSPTAQTLQIKWQQRMQRKESICNGMKDISAIFNLHLGMEGIIDS